MMPNFTNNMYYSRTLFYKSEYVLCKAQRAFTLGSKAVPCDTCLHLVETHLAHARHRTNIIMYHIRTNIM